MKRKKNGHHLWTSISIESSIIIRDKNNILGKSSLKKKKRMIKKKEKWTLESTHYNSTFIKDTLQAKIISHHPSQILHGLSCYRTH